MGRKGWKRGVVQTERERRKKEMQVVASCEPLLLLHQQQQCSSYNPPATAPTQRAETMKKFKKECSSLVVRK